MTRIEAISSYITEEEKVIDVGCDQALLSKLLAKRGIYSIATDIKKSIIDSASKNLTKEEKKYITFRVGDGITLKEEETDYTLVMSGMGSYLMIDILKKNNKYFDKIITISNNNHFYLRENMSLMGYKIKLEEIIYDKGKFYNLIIFEKEKSNYSYSELLLGVNHKNMRLFKVRNKMVLNVYKNIVTRVTKKEDKEKLDNIISILEENI